MNSTYAQPVLIAVLFIGALGSTLRAVDWKTTDGKVYEDVKLIRLDADTVTILHKNGGAQIPLARLSPDLQARFGYDPDLAKAAAGARTKEAALNARQLQAEMDTASAKRQAGQEDASDATAMSGDATGSDASKNAASASTGGTHHFMDEIAASALGPKPAAANVSRHSIDEATQSATAMRRDLSDPTYHTMAHMFYTVRTNGLGPDAGDATHHAIDETTQAASRQK